MPKRGFGIHESVCDCTARPDRSRWSNGLEIPDDVPETSTRWNQASRARFVAEDAKRDGVDAARVPVVQLHQAGAVAGCRPREPRCVINLFPIAHGVR